MKTLRSVERLSAIFKGGPPLIPFLTAGFPSVRVFLDAVAACVEAGAGAIEIGVPFSDPLADGPAIQYSSQAALARGIDLDKVLELTAKVRSRHDLPILLMGYLNPVLRRGLDRFAAQIREAGADGTIIPDCPVDEAGPWITASRTAGLANVFLVAPTTTDERISVIDRSSTVFSYCVSVAGVTGARSGVEEKTKRFLKRVRRQARKPFVVGFGIAKPDHIRALSGLADGFVVGSALINLLTESPDKSGVRRIESLIRGMTRTAYAA